MPGTVENLLSVVSSLVILTLAGLIIYGIVVYGKKIQKTYDQVEQAATAVNNMSASFKTYKKEADEILTSMGGALSLLETYEGLKTMAASYNCAGCALCQSKNSTVQDIIKGTNLCKAGGGGCFDTTQCSANSTAASTLQEEGPELVGNRHRYGTAVGPEMVGNRHRYGTAVGPIY